MDDSLAADQRVKSPARPYRDASDLLNEHGIQVARRCEIEEFAVIGPQVTKRGVAQPHSLFKHRIEHRDKITGRGVDDAQYLGGRGLLLQRLARFGDQPCVLDRDHGLIGEGADQFDLPLGERLYTLPTERNYADRFALTQ